MYKAYIDIKFLEQLIDTSFDNSYFLMFANDPLFYINKGDYGIYNLFRMEKRLKSEIIKTTGKKTLN